MHKYFKEINELEEVIGVCSILYKDIKTLDEYKQQCFRTIEITEKEYSQLRKQLGENKC